ncbi:RNA polymerase sigma factor [Patescibacteria group bacterium]|nr:RNA polymerase sigma factor [Patescibacteria group bacterium]
MADAHQAFEKAFEEYSDELFRHASIRLSDRERALELTQECFTRTWEYMARGGQVLNFRPFLYRTLKHLIIDEYRKHKTHSLEAMVEESDGGSVEMFLPADETNTLAAAVERFEGTEALQKLRELPDLYREVLLMRYVEGLVPKEIAEYLEESENTVSVRIHRGLHKLRALLEETDMQ